MIQRIQTLWLAFVIVLTAASFFFPLAELSYDYNGIQSGTYGFLPQSNTIYKNLDRGDVYTWSLIFMQIGIGLFALVSIFFYTKRQLQMRIVAGGVLFIMIYIAFVLFVKIDGLSSSIENLYKVKVNIEYNKIALSFPILQLLLMVLAQRAIKKDERIVRSSDRLR